MRKKYIIAISKRVIKSSITTFLLLTCLTFAQKYQERQYQLLQAKNARESNFLVNKEQEKISIVKLDVYNASSPLVYEVMEKTTENVIQQETETMIEQDTNQEVLEQPEIVQEEKEYVTEPYLIECTAYNPTGNPCKDGSYPVEGETVAGKSEWLGRSCNLYYCNKDGKIGNLIGMYTFHDTGFGHDSDGDGIGSIQTGERIDLFMESHYNAINWGVRNVYIEFLD